MITMRTEMEFDHLEAWTRYNLSCMGNATYLFQLFIARVLQTMKLLVFSLLISTAAAAPSGTLPRWPLRRLLQGKLIRPPTIVGGDVAERGEIPWQVSMKAITFFGPSHFCGASIYDKNWIITAAHCVEDVNIQKLLLVAGEYDLTVEEGDEQELSVEKLIMHEGFVSQTYENDIALLKTTVPIKFTSLVQSIPLPAQGDLVSEGTNATASGWGYLHPDDTKVPALLHKVVVPVISDTQCRNCYGFNNIADTMLCAGYEAGGRDTCQNDSGGPLFTKQPLALIGIVSWGNGCAEPGYPGVYTEMTYYVDWVVEQVSQN